MMLLGHLSSGAHVHGLDVGTLAILCGIVVVAYAALKFSK